MSALMTATTSGIVLSDEELANVEGLEDLLNEYEHKGSKYTLSTTCKQFVTSISAGKTKLKVSSLSMEGVAHSRFVDTVEQLAKQLVDYQDAENELLALQQRLEGSGDENAHNAAAAAAPSSSSTSLHREYLQTEKMLTKLLEEQAQVDLALRQRQSRKEQVLQSLQVEVEESQSSAVQAAVAKADPFAAAEQREFEATLGNIEATRVEAEALLQGLQSLTGISSIRVEEASAGSRPGVQLRVSIGALECVLVLDSDRKLYDMYLTKGAYASLQDVLTEAAVLPSPQDLRYAIFALGAVQNAPATLQQHLSELRKRCIVRSNGYSASSSAASVQVTLSNGVTACISVHACYPEVPGGVSIDSLVGIGTVSPLHSPPSPPLANRMVFLSSLPHLTSPHSFTP